VTMELTITHAFTSTSFAPVATSGLVIVPLIKATLFFAVKAVITAFSHNSKFLPSNLSAVIMASGHPRGVNSMEITD